MTCAESASGLAMSSAYTTSLAIIDTRLRGCAEADSVPKERAHELAEDGQGRQHARVARIGLCELNLEPDRAADHERRPDDAVAPGLVGTDDDRLETGR